jgi:methylthioribose-1-phosphate isomerase
VTANGGQAWFTVRWSGEGVQLLDQRRLPGQEIYLTLTSVEEVAQAIESLAVRGAPAIGCTAALGVARCAVTSAARDLSGLKGELQAARERLARTRPTAVNLFWALSRMGDVIDAELARPGSNVSSVRDRLVREAQAILDEDIAACRALGEFGLPLVPDGARILTHCNAGALATGGFGTALGVVRAAVKAGRRVSVLADETRPFLQGARLTAWELDRDGIPVTVITDNMSAHLMQRGEVDLVVVGADRIAANGDVANKIGTYGVAVLAREHGIPFYVAAPLSSASISGPREELGFPSRSARERRWPSSTGAPWFPMACRSVTRPSTSPPQRSSMRSSPIGASLVSPTLPLLPPFCRLDAPRLPVTDSGLDSCFKSGYGEGR